MTFFRCKILTTAFTLVLFGIALAIVIGVLWPYLLLVSLYGRLSSGTNVGRTVGVATALFSGWLLITCILSALVTIVSGFIGIVTGCQRGQCITLTYLVSCALTCFSNVCTLIGLVVVLMDFCIQGMDKCMKVDDGMTTIVLFCITGLSFFIVLVTVIASITSCSARCHCCYDTHVESINEETNPDVLVMVSPSAPPYI